MKLHWGVLFLSGALIIGSPSWAATASTSVDVNGNSSSTSTRVTKKVDLNTASKAELETLPGVGSATADQIIAARPFKSVNDLKNVKGIGDTRFAELRSQVTVSNRHVASSANTSTAAKTTDRTTTHAASPGHRIDLNTADSTTLQTLPGVGAATAQNIIAARPFKSVDDLRNVRGVGETRLEQLRPLVTVHASTRTATSPSAGTAASSETSTSTKSSTYSNPGPQTSLGKGAEQKGTGNTAETKININTASLQELEALPGIGPVKAQAIIDNRPFSSIEDVMKVKGIKEGTFAEIKDRIRTN